MTASMDQTAYIIEWFGTTGIMIISKDEYTRRMIIARLLHGETLASSKVKHFRYERKSYFDYRVHAMWAQPSLHGQMVSAERRAWNSPSEIPFSIRYLILENF